MAIANARRPAALRRISGLGQALAHRLGWPTIAPGLVAGGVLIAVGVADGGLFPRTWRLAIFALATLAAATLLARTRVVITRIEWLTLAGFAGYAGWLAASAAWSGRPSDSLLEGERAVVYVVALLAILLIAQRASVAQLLAGVLAGVTAVSAYGLAKYVFAPPPLDPFEGDLLFQPIGYANALGIFAAIGVLVAIGLALAWRERLRRAVALLPLAVLLPTVYLTHSRGAWLALAVGIACLVVVGGRPRRRRVAALLLTVAVGATGLAILASGGRPTTAQLVGENRPRYWRVALEDFADHPLLGSGAGTFGEVWLRQRGVTSFSRDAHSIYLQSLAELGVVGLVLILLALGVPLATLRRRGDPLLATAAASYVAFVVHVGLDWDWELPAATLAGVFCGAALLVAGRSRDDPPVRLPVRVALVLLASLLAIGAALRLQTGPGLPLGP